ncbi:hypothetical protein MSG28_015100, partial [Choristoneura fumiferana]
MCFIPSVKAAYPPKVPERPKPMKYKDLPLYESPHYEYKDHNADKLRCPIWTRKLWQTILLPHVSVYRKEVQKTLCFAKSELIDTYKEVKTDYRTAEKRILNYMRDPKNDTLKKACMTIGETDEGFRTFMYYVGKGLVAFYNSYCGKNFSFRERVACTRDLPTMPKVPTKPLPA